MNKTINDKIEIYSKPGCTYCIQTKLWLSDKGIPFEEINIVGNKEALHKVKDNGFSGLPVVSINDFEYAWQGYNEQELEKLFESVELHGEE